MSSDYIFTAMNQSFLSNELDGRIHPVLNGECGDLISKVLCHYFFAPCGANGSLHLPLSICSEECNYVQSACANEWRIVNNLLNNAGITMINCKATSTLLKGLTPCCIDAGIEIASKKMIYLSGNIDITELQLCKQERLHLLKEMGIALPQK